MSTNEKDHVQWLMVRYNLTMEKAQQFQKDEKLWEAAWAGDQRAVQSALNLGADVSFKHPDKVGRTPISVASMEGHVGTVQLLLIKGADPNSTDNNHCTPLHFAYSYNRTDVVELLVLYGGDLQQVKKDMLLLEAESTAELKRALAEGANIHVCHPLKDDKTALHLAAERGITEQLDLLIAYSANVNSKDKYKRTPLHLAAKTNNVHAIKLLTLKGAIVNDRDNDGATPLHLACAESNVDGVFCLLNTPHVNPLSLNDNEQLAIECLPLKSKEKFRLLKLFRPFIRNQKELQVNALPKVFVCGNAKAGKSSILEVIKRYSEQNRDLQSNSVESPALQSGGFIYSQLNQSSRSMITVDFVGHNEYFKTHTEVLDNIVISSPGVFLVMAELIDNINVFEKMLYFWFRYIETACLHLSKPSTVLVIGSHFDSFTDDIDLINIVVKDTAKSGLRQQKYLGFIPMDCRRPDRAKVDEFLKVFEEGCKAVTDAKGTIPYECHALYAFLQTIEATAVDVQEVLTLVRDQQEPCLPTDASTVKEFLVTLGDKGLILFLKSAGWIIMDEVTLLKEVNEVIFHGHVVSSNTGIIPVSSIARVFPNYNIDMLVSFLVSMEVCHVVDTEAMALISTNIHQSTGKMEKLLYFPALVSVEHPLIIPSITKGIGWCLFCPKPVEYLSTRFLEVLLNRCAYSYALGKRVGKLNESISVQNLERSCTVWKNGIYWKCDGNEYQVDVSDHYRLVKVIVSHNEEHVVAGLRVFSCLISDIMALIAKYCPKCSYDDYLISPTQLQEALTCSQLKKLKLYSTGDLARSTLLKSLVRDTRDTYLKVKEVLVNQDPYLCIAPVITRELFNDKKAEVKLTKGSIEHIHKACPELIVHLPSSMTHRAVKETFNQFTVFAGRNLLEMAYPKIARGDVENATVRTIQSMPPYGKYSVPALIDILNMLVEVAPQWYEIGDCLQVNKSELDLLRESTESDILKLSHVLSIWMDEKPTPIIWDSIMTVVSGPIINNQTIIEKIEEFLKKKDIVLYNTLDLSQFVAKV